MARRAAETRLVVAALQLVHRGERDRGVAARLVVLAGRAEDGEMRVGIARVQALDLLVGAPAGEIRRVEERERRPGRDV
jgi:hypothetical protein